MQLPDRKPAERANEMPPVTSTDYAVTPKGTYLTQLCDIETKSSKQTGSDGVARDSSFWVWKFRGYNMKDPAKKAVPVEITTGTAVTKNDSALKTLLMSAFPDKNLDDLKTFNTDEMVGKAWVIKLGIGEKPNGGEKNIILNIEATEEDPFADDDD